MRLVSSYHRTMCRLNGLTVLLSRCTSTYFEGINAVDAAHEQVITLGGRLLKAADDRTTAHGFQVYADPAGHPFCLCWIPEPS
jgi:glyoxalase superfamily protein